MLLQNMCNSYKHIWSVFKEDTASNADVTSLRMSYGAALKPVLKAVQRYKNDHWAVPRRPRGSHRRRRPQRIPEKRK
jgi:hypothetical protein